jgi:hypothetical protein
MRAHTSGTLVDQVFCSFIGAIPREDFVPYVADFFLQLEHVKWTVIAGVVNGSLTVSVRNLGYMKNAGEFVRRVFADVGSAGGHRSMAKAVMPFTAFVQKFGVSDPAAISARLQDLVAQFLHDAPKETKAQKLEARIEQPDEVRR